MNVISDWLLQYVRRKKRVFSSCNPAVCIPWKGRIGSPTIKWKQTVREVFFFGFMESVTMMAQNRPVHQAAM